MRKVSLQLLGVFLLAQFAALFVGASFPEARVSVVENPSDVGNSVWFFAYILFSTALILLILKFYKGKKLFFAFELLLEFTTVQLFVSLFASEAVALLSGVFFVVVRVLLPPVKAWLLLFASAIVGALLGSSLDVTPAILLSVLLAGYDAYAVFGTKHMVTLAKQLEARGAAFAIALKEGKESIQLGTGDVVIPAMLSVSALRLSEATPFIPAFFALAGAFLGLLTVILILEKKKTYLPALPPLVAGVFASLAVYWFVAKPFLAIP